MGVLWLEKFQQWWHFPVIVSNSNIIANDNFKLQQINSFLAKINK